MVREGFSDYLKGRGVRPETIDAMVTFADDFDHFLDEKDQTIDDCEKTLLNDHLAQLVKEERNDPDRLVAIARYCAFCKRPELFIQIAVILNSYDILPLLEKRLDEVVGSELREAVFHGWTKSPLGTPPEDYPPWTSRIIGRMEGELTPEQCRTVLTWNYHEIPKEAFAEKKARFEAARSLDEFLKQQHQVLVDELKGCLKDGKVWYEQEVTKEFVQHVASDQRVQTGVREGDRIICEKVPYDPKHYYAETDPVLRRYHYCHCPLVRSAIKAGKPKISPTFCYCSAGFEKTAWDAIFDEPVEVDVLQTVLGGSDRCTFSIKVPEGKLK